MQQLLRAPLLALLCLIFMNHLYAEDSYTETLQKIKTHRKKVKQTYLSATAKEKDALLSTTRTYLISTLVDDIFPAWYGTPWEFYGRTTIPQQGQIACGYFVTHTLSDLGFTIPKTRWAQQASERFMKKLSPSALKRFSNAPMENICTYLKKRGDGVYLVGLDCHVGYVVVNSDAIRFIHSSYYHPDIGVMSESIRSKNPLSDSSYRVFGKLFSDNMVTNWILQKPYQ